MQKAETSAYYLWLLNRVLWRSVPFNKPHKFRINTISKDTVEVRIPYRRKNLNHLGGLHACSMATAAEYASGLLLLRNVDLAKYRLIMQSISVIYHYQGKLQGVARFSISDDWLDTYVLNPLNENDSITISPEVEIHDVEGNHLCTAKMTWQIKHWDRVKTRAVTN